MADIDASSDATETGFLRMSHLADSLAHDRPRRNGAETASEREAGQGSEFQRFLIDEIDARPLRALGWAAAAGFLFGIWVSR